MPLPPLLVAVISFGVMNDVELKSECDKLKKNHEEALLSYQNRISATEKDTTAFNALLDKLFFAE